MSDICDGKMCKEGKHAGGGHYVCPHNNLAIRYPEIAREWDYEKNEKGPEMYLSRSHTRVWWICPRGHSYANLIDKRTGRDYKCPWCSGKKGKVLLEKSLESKYPEVVKQWDYTKNTSSPKDYLPLSGEEVFWLCEYGHKWKEPIINRVQSKGCPDCTGRLGKIVFEKTLKYLYPELADEWDYGNNLGSPEEYTYGSNQKISWVCSKDKSHRWMAAIKDRTSNQSGCPWCLGRPGYVSFEKSLLFLYPEIAGEWDHIKNIESPSNFLPFSHDRVWWICNNKHSYCKTIADRTANGTGCQGCKSLAFLYPELTKEWDYDKNIELPTEVFAYSHNSVHWVCARGHKWSSKVYSRTRENGNGCPWCSSRDGKVLFENSLLFLYPNLAEEWDYERNLHDPGYFSFGSKEKVYWVCCKGHKWEAIIGSRTRENGNGCPHCSTIGYSKSQIKWLQSIEQRDNITIQHAESLEGEYYIDEVGKVDGYCHQTNTVYEFHGDYWHGNPSKFSPEDIHPINNKTYGELYQRTLDRDNKILDLGYRLVTIWESDWRTGKKETIRRKLRIKKIN